MKLRSLPALCTVVVAVACLTSGEALTSDHPKKEEIYVIRSVRLSRDMPSEYCSAEHTGFPDFFRKPNSSHPVTTSKKNGAVVSTEGQKTASLHACFGRRAIQE